MRCVLALCLLLATGILLVAGPVRPVPVPEPAAAAKPLEEQQFATQLFAVQAQIAELYVRPVPADEIAYAALAGLYDAARLPVPAKLREDVRSAVADQSLILLYIETRKQVGAVEALQGPKALLVACRAIARSLDPYCDVVIGAEQRKSVGLEGEANGVGVELTSAGGGPVALKTVYPGGSAQRAGLRPGDEITALNDKPIGKLSTEQIEQLLFQGPPDPTDLRAAPLTNPDVRVTYRRPETKVSRTATLRLEHFTPEIVLGVRRDDDNRWNYWIDADRHLAHVRLTTLMRGSSSELRAVVGQLHRAGMTGMILDLRWCPGGYLDEAVDAARLFLGTGDIATIKTRQGKPTVYRGDDSGSGVTFPMVVLVNGDTLGGAELVASALQDHGRATVVGQRTRGKASVQSSIYLPVPGAGMKLTSGTFIRPNGKNLHRFPDSKSSDDWGVQPDTEFRISADLERKLARSWLEYSLRPAESMERLPLDDPQSDPSQQEALAVLRDMSGANWAVKRR